MSRSHLKKLRNKLKTKIQNANKDEQQWLLPDLWAIEAELNKRGD